MSKKERDIWDDAIRSKLEDFEMDTLPGDWEAIADRLPGKAPVPLRRTLRYWVAAAVISLLVVSGGIYLYDREMEDLPIAQEIQSSQESTSVDTPVVPVEKTMEQAPVLATIPAAAVVKAKAASGAVKVGAKARMAAFRQNVESAEDRPISESEVMSADIPANEKDTVEPEVERNNDEIVVLKNDVLVADATPVAKKKPEKTASRKWGFGMGGGGLSMGADNLVPQYVTNSSVLKSENLMSLNSFDAEKKDPAKTDIHHKTPIGVGISISRYLNNRFSLQTGLTYSYLRSEWSTNNTYHIENDQRLHFIGIPLSLTYKIAEWNRFMFYASAGGMAEVNVAGKRRMKLFSDEVEIAKQSEHIRMKEWLWSVNARAGVSYPIIRFVSAFAEVGASYYFDNGSEIETIHSENPFTDISKNDYFYDAVLWAVEEGITSGTSDTTFSPNVSCTRAQMVTFLWRVSGFPKASITNPFTDVSADAYYYDAVLWAVEQGITGGTGDGKFSPDAPCTRAQMATFLWRAAGSPAPASNVSAFTDVPEGSWYAKAVQWAYEQNITNGTGDGKFSPDATCTRAQMVQMLKISNQEFHVVK